MRASFQRKVMAGLKGLVTVASDKFAEINDMQPLERLCCVDMMSTDGWDKMPDSWQVSSRNKQSLAHY